MLLGFRAPQAILGTTKIIVLAPRTDKLASPFLQLNLVDSTAEFQESSSIGTSI
jgi:hypothetical protein